MSLINKDFLTESEQKIAFEQYKLYVEMADRVSQRRMGANTFFYKREHFVIYSNIFFRLCDKHMENSYMLFRNHSMLCLVFYAKQLSKT